VTREAYHDHSRQFQGAQLSTAEADYTPNREALGRKHDRHPICYRRFQHASADPADRPCRQSRRYDGLSSPVRDVRIAKSLNRCACIAAWLTLGASLLPLGGCAVVALPCRLSAATLRIVPVVGHAAAVPFDACAAAID
jgi:hypothetical protein